MSHITQRVTAGLAADDLANADGYLREFSARAASSETLLKLQGDVHLTAFVAPPSGHPSGSLEGASAQELLASALERCLPATSRIP